MSEERKIRLNGKELGKFTFNALHRMRMAGEIDHTAEFFSENKQHWLPITGIMEDWSPSTRVIKHMKDGGITKVGFVLGWNKGDCPLCKSLAEKAYSVDEVPTLPPRGCTCMPWCSLVVSAVQ